MMPVDKTTSALICYAIATEVDAITMYMYLIKTLPPENRKVLAHILKEEQEHAEELLGLLKGRYEA